MEKIKPKYIRKTIYRYTWEFFNKEDVRIFKDFKNVAMIKAGESNLKNPRERLLLTFMKRYLEKNTPKFTIATEKELVAICRDEGIPISREMLKYYRDTG